jgi:hypothetical protein
LKKNLFLNFILVFFMAIMNRYRLDNNFDRHNIVNPYSQEKPRAMELYVHTLLRTRIPELCKTARGLPGHVMQLQQEINRLAKVRGRSKFEIDRAIQASKIIRGALKKATQAKNVPFQLPWHSYHQVSIAE